MPRHSLAAERGDGVWLQRTEQLKMTKYAHLGSSHYFVPFAVETSGMLGRVDKDFTQELG